MPAFYIETHVGDRERTARALSLLASWDDLQKDSRASLQTQHVPASSSRKQKALGIAVDADTGVLIRFDATSQIWVGEVYGARVAEFLSPTANSQVGLNSQNQPFATSYSSNALLSGGKITLSGSGRGNVLVHNAGALTAPASGSCSNKLPSSVDGKYDEDALKASQVAFDALDPATGKSGDFNVVQYAYLSGDLVVKNGSGCGYWQSNAFNPDYGRPENRLNAQRFALGAGLASFAVAVPPSMEVRASGRGSSMRFVARSGAGSSSLVYDVSHASQRTVGKYIYKELGASKPIQVGGWENGTVHLIPAGSTFDFAAMAVNGQLP